MVSLKLRTVNAFNRFVAWYNNGYVPIGTHPKKRLSNRTCVLAAAALVFLVSLALNFYFIIKHILRFTSPLDDYQEL